MESEKEMFDFYNSHNIKYMVQKTSSDEIGIVEFPTEWAELKHDFGLDAFESAVRAVDELKLIFK